MPTYRKTGVHCLLAGMLLCCAGGCAHISHLPDVCADSFHHSRLGLKLQDVCDHLDLACCECEPGNTCVACQEIEQGGTTKKRREKRPPRMVVGPPPVPYRPPMPPKFLPVPARSVFTTVNPNAPTLESGQIEHGLGGEIQFPAGD